MLNVRKNVVTIWEMNKMGNGATIQQRDIEDLFEIINGIMFQLGFHYGATISQKLKNKTKELKKRLLPDAGM